MRKAKNIPEPEPDRLDDEQPWEETDPEMQINNRIQQIKEDVAKMAFAMEQAKIARQKHALQINQILEEGRGLQVASTSKKKQASPNPKKVRE